MAIVEINNIAGYVVVDPGEVDVKARLAGGAVRDTIIFRNLTNSPVTLYLADSGVLKNTPRMGSGKTIASGHDLSLDVTTKDAGLFDYAVLFKTATLTKKAQKRRGKASRGFAVGGSSPRIRVTR
jgi:hypothetical protein